ncbi:MAG: nucleotidyltransferase [Chlorobi bacterium]|nr:nucleotidyltransferase [Chlorobiota bacterium]
MKPTLIVLAAGIGSRYGGLKQIDAVGPSGEAIIDYSIYDAIRAGFGKVVFVIRKSIEKDVRAFFEPRLRGRIDLDFVYQEIDMVPPGITITTERKKPWGTAHAVLVAKDLVHGPFAVINGDDFYGPSSYRQIAEFLTRNTNPDEYAMVGFQLDKTLSAYGSVARGVCSITGEGHLQEVTEHTKIIIREGKIISVLENGSEVIFSGKEQVSMNFWGFKPSAFDRIERLFRDFIRDHGDDPGTEFFIPVPLTKLIHAGEIQLKILESRESWFGVTYQEDKPEVIRKISDLVNKGIYPRKLWD